MPPGALRADARDGVAVDDALCRLCVPDTIMAFANYFRYALIRQQGGGWVDTDVDCLTDVLPDERYAWAEQEPGLISNAILRFPQGDPLCGGLAELARTRAESSVRLGAIAVDLVTEVLGSSEEGHRAGSRGVFPARSEHWTNHRGGFPGTNCLTPCEG